MARMIDADAMLAELMPITYEMEHTSVLISDMSKIMRKWVERQPTLTQPNELRAGLYGKYTVYKNKDGSLVTDCFILRPAKDPAAVAALRAYAAATDNAELAADIINWVGAEPNEPLTLDELQEMDGQPVFLETGEVSIREQLIAEWEILTEHDDSWFYFTRRKRGFHIKDYGKTWIAYRRPPEGEEET